MCLDLMPKSSQLMSMIQPVFLQYFDMSVQTSEQGNLSGGSRAGCAYQRIEQDLVLMRCREMTAARDALEQELKHNEKEFASLVTEELEQRFAHFEDVTLAAFSKISPTNSAMPGPLPLPYRTPTGLLQPPGAAPLEVLGELSSL